MPALGLAAEGTAIILRMVRSSMLEQTGQDYVRVLRAKVLRCTREPCVEDRCWGCVRRDVFCGVCCAREGDEVHA